MEEVQYYTCDLVCVLVCYHGRRCLSVKHVLISPSNPSSFLPKSNPSVLRSRDQIKDRQVGGNAEDNENLKSRRKVSLQGYKQGEIILCMLTTQRER